MNHHLCSHEKFGSLRGKAMALARVIIANSPNLAVILSAKSDFALSLTCADHIPSARTRNGLFPPRVLQRTPCLTDSN